MIININDQQLNMNILNDYINGNSVNLSQYFNDIDPFIDLTITSPPYWDAKQYGEFEQTGFKQNYESYLCDLKSIFTSVFNLSKQSASLFLIIDTIKRDGKMVRLPDDVAKILEDIGWIHQDTIIWDKGKTLPWSRKGQTRNIFEYVLMFTKSKNYKYNIDHIKTVDELKEWWIDYPERYSPEGKVPENIWRFNIPTQGSWGSKSFDDLEFRHACPFPPKMMARLIKLSSDEGDVIFDPFAGTGVLLATANQLNRKFLGFDTNPNYKQVFEKVTTPLVQKQWEEIECYDNLQEELKNKLKTTIYKLRMLKFPKALIKKLNKTINFKNDSLDESADELIAVIALEHLMEKDDNISPKNKIGKVSYYFIYNQAKVDQYDNKINLINELIEKPPFSKYGLIVDISLVSKESFGNEMYKELDENLYLYAKGNTRSMTKRVTKNEILNLINEDGIYELFYKNIPPIFSNISLLEEEYNMIPAEKYEKNYY